MDRKKFAENQVQQNKRSVSKKTYQQKYFKMKHENKKAVKKMNRASVIYSKQPNTFAMDSQKKSVCLGEGAEKYLNK